MSFRCFAQACFLCDTCVCPVVFPFWLTPSGSRGCGLLTTATQTVEFIALDSERDTASLPSPWKYEARVEGERIAEPQRQHVEQTRFEAEAVVHQNAPTPQCQCVEHGVLRGCSARLVFESSCLGSCTYDPVFAPSSVIWSVSPVLAVTNVAPALVEYVISSNSVTYCAHCDISSCDRDPHAGTCHDSYDTCISDRMRGGCTCH